MKFTKLRALTVALAVLLGTSVSLLVADAPTARAGDLPDRRVIEDTVLDGSTKTTQGRNYCGLHPITLNGSTKIALLTFDATVPSGQTLTAARLRLDFWEGSSQVVQVYKRTVAANCSVTWNSAGTQATSFTSTDLVGSRTGTTVGAGYDDITLDPAKLPTSGQVHLAVKLTNAVNINFNSDETGGADYPRLVLTTTPTSTTTSTTLPPTTTSTTLPPTTTSTTLPPTTTTSPPPPGRADQAGIAIPYNRLRNLTDAQMGAELDLVKATGANWLRVDVPGVEMEITQGTTNWAVIDRIMTAADARQIKVLGACTTLPVWARPANTLWNYGPQTTAQRDAMVDFCRRAAQRYNGRMDAWEIWNEQNLDQFWTPAPSMSNYLALLQAAYPALKAVTSVPVLVGGTGWAGGAPDIDSVVFYQQLYSLGGKPYFDAANTHPYPDLAGIQWGETAKAVQIRQTMNNNGDSAKPLWGTETGAPTGGQFSTTEANQAKLLTDTYNLWIGPQIVPNGPLFTYTLRDTGGTDREGYFGIVRTDGTRKPAFTSLQTWIAS